MIDSAIPDATGATAAAGVFAGALSGDLSEERIAELSEQQLVDLITACEDAKCRLEAAQATAAVALDTATRTRHREQGVPARRIGEGVAAQIGLARRISPHKASRLLGLATILTREMPATLALMRAGRLSEWRATILARETACLDLEHRRRVDLELAGTGRAAELGDRELEATAKKLAYTLDAHAVVARAARAETERSVTIRPAPDLMSYVTALLPMKQGVAVYAALKAVADTASATGHTGGAGDDRSRGQVMADTLVERVTGRAAGAPARIDLRLVMTDRALLAPDGPGGDAPALVPGYGPVPAEWARTAVTRALTDTLTEAQVFLKRLFTHPLSGQLVAMDSRSRTAPAGLAEFITLRDGGICRNPHCGAPIRHLDHIQRYADGGPTSAANLQGLCERCNQAKEAPGWQARPGPDGSITITTATGHTYRSRPPDPWPTTRPLVNLVLANDYALTA
ncbi:HNH endonuclease [Nocardioides cheoyonin]|uniref:HNH endonuclease n=1 Tax=Nocardioides cheoyonin TaxID=3156615 RepID=UPI0032B3C637